MGTVYLVGAGPGAADLLTVRAVRLLQQADVVFHDALIEAEVLALAPQAVKVAVGKRSGRHSTAQAFINKRLIDAARKHAVVVRLKGGDPMLFGRAQEEIAALDAAGVPYAVVPGVTAALAAAAELKVSLTRRGAARSVAFATPRVAKNERGSNWAETIAAADTAAIYMGAGEASAIAQALLAQGRPDHWPVVAVENATLPSARFWRTTLAELPQLAAAHFSGPVLLLFGEVFAQIARSSVAVVPRSDRRSRPAR